MVNGERGAEVGVPEMQVSATSDTPGYRNLLDLPVAVFCRFISDAGSDVTDSQIALWWGRIL